MVITSVYRNRFENLLGEVASAVSRDDRTMRQDDIVRHCLLKLTSSESPNSGSYYPALSPEFQRRALQASNELQPAPHLVPPVLVTSYSRARGALGNCSFLISILKWVLLAEEIDGAVKSTLKDHGIDLEFMERVEPALVQWVDQDWIEITRLSHSIGRDGDLVSVSRRLLAAIKLREHFLIVGDKGVGKSRFTDSAVLVLARESERQFGGEGSNKKFVIVRQPTTLLSESIDKALGRVYDLMHADEQVVPIFDDFDRLMSDREFADAFKALFGQLLHTRGARSLVFATRTSLMTKESQLFEHCEKVRLKELPWSDTSKVLQRRLRQALSQHTHLKVENSNHLVLELLRQTQLHFPGHARPGFAIRQLERVLDLANSRFSAETQSIVITLEFVKEVIAEQLGIAAEELTEDLEQKFDRIRSEICKHLIGQEHAVDRLCRQIKQKEEELLSLAEDGFDPEADKFEPGYRPVQPLRCLLVGPSGLGKTETAYALARHLGRNLEVFEMNKFTTKMSQTDLVGSSVGYEGSGESGTVYSAIAEDKRTIFLLDEIEKAHPDIQNILLGILEGKGKDYLGQTVHFSHAIFLLTTNYGEDLVAKDYRNRLASAANTADGAPTSEGYRYDICMNWSTKELKTRLTEGVGSETEAVMLKFVTSEQNRLGRHFEMLHSAYGKHIDPESGVVPLDVSETDEFKLLLNELNKTIDDHQTQQDRQSGLEQNLDRNVIGSAMVDRMNEIIPFPPFVLNSRIVDHKPSRDDRSVVLRLIRHLLTAHYADFKHMSDTKKMQMVLQKAALIEDSNSVRTVIEIVKSKQEENDV